jgi:multidrug efflux pump subunit AcrA (membrane-fusion protein)
MSRSLYKAICLLTGTLIFLSACGSGSSRNPTPTPVPPLVSYEKSIFTVERGSIVSEQDVMGEVVPAKQDDLFFRSSGYVTRVAVKVGDTVKKGDILAEMQIDDLLNQLQQAQIDLEVTQADLAKYNAQHQFDIEKAKSDVIISQKEVDLAQIDLKNLTGVELEKAQVNLEIAQQKLSLAEESLNMIQAETNPYAEQAVKRSQLAVGRLQGLIAERQVIAPYDSIILRTFVREGQQVDAYINVFTIGDPSDLVTRTNYDYQLAGIITKNSEVSLSLTSDGQDPHPVQYLPYFIPASSNTDTSQSSSSDFMYYSLPEDMPAEDLPIGKTVYLTIILGRKDNVLLLPPAAIRQYRGLYFVILLDGDTRRRVEINEIGLRAKDRWEIVADLREGDQVQGP